MSDKINTVFKQVFKKFLKEDMRSCQRLLDRVEKCETYRDLKDALEDYAEDIGDHLGYDCSECEEKDDIIQSLEYNLGEAEEKLSEQSYTPQTLNDVYMLEAFVNNKDKFTVAEFEALMN